MVDEYIKRTDVIQALEKDKIDFSEPWTKVISHIGDEFAMSRFDQINMDCDRHITLVKDIPAVAVHPYCNLQNGWCYIPPGSEGDVYSIECRECGAEYTYSVAPDMVPVDFHYCPNCGAFFQRGMTRNERVY